MGTWGTGPFDNDSAADMIAGFMKPIEKVIGAKSDRTAQNYYHEARASAQIVLMAHGTDVLGGPEISTLAKALERMRNDSEWIATWRDPAKIRKALDKEIRAIKRKIKTCCELAATKRSVRRVVRVTAFSFDGKRVRRVPSTRAK